MIIKKNTSINVDQNKINKLANEFKLDQNIIRLLISRGYTTKEQIYNFLNPDLNNFYDPYLLVNMDKVVARIRQAVQDDISIVILGDYDTDGITATAIMYKYFQSIGKDVYTFLPNRIADGYGLSYETIDKVIEMYNPKLIITVDCGISAKNDIEYANSKGVEVIVTDHHDIPEQVPNCLIINPKLHGQKYPFRELCGAGVALKVVQALTSIEESYKYLTIAAIATVADIVPLVDENRLITYYGIKQQASNMPMGLMRLLKKLRIDMPLTSADISFKLAPKINATGRMGDPNIAFRLYISEDSKEINKNIESLLLLNDKRVLETNHIVEQAVAMLDNVNTSKQGVIIVKDDNWESGVLGIICSKLVDMYNKPACVLSMVDGELKGSLRSIPNINIFEALTSVKDTLVQYGGHNQAAGVTLKKENYNKFVKELNEYVLSHYKQDDFLLERKYDLDLSKSVLTEKFVKELFLLEPFGLANEKPLFKLTFNNVVTTLMPKFPAHVKLKVNGVELIGFNMGQYLYNFNTNSNKTIIMELSLDKYTNVNKLKGVIKHITFSKLNTTIKTELINGLYLYQLNNINCVNKTNNKPEIMEMHDLYKHINNLKSKFGTLIISNSVSSYEQFNLNTTKITNYELYDINNKTGINTLLFAPFDNVKLNNYETIILLDAPFHIGYVNYLINIGKKVIIANTLFDTKCLKNLDCNRAVFARYHNAIKHCCKKYINEPDILSLFYKVKRTNQQFTNIKFNEFCFVLIVLKELGICKVDGGKVSFTDVKSNLNNSQSYNFINLLLNSTKGE